MLNEIAPALIPAAADLLGARIEYIHARPFAMLPMIEHGTVIETKQRGDKTHILVKPDQRHLVTRWRDVDTDLLRILPETQTAAAVMTSAAA